MSACRLWFRLVVAAKTFTLTIVMSTPLVTWCCIVGIVTLFFLGHAFSRVRQLMHGKHSIFHLASERELFYVPGDPDPKIVIDEEECDGIN